ncbi:hypothetical protein ACLB1G_26680 [Oxalobacteraceae bacterium A2-2]
MLSQAPIPGVAPATVLTADFDGHHAGVSWSAVFAGAAAAAALSFILLILGFGLGLSAVSPWRYSDAPIGRSTILWLTFMQLASAAVGGYLAGRLRVKWASVHDDEVYFRDTAHGLLAWAVATLLTAAVMAGAVSAVFSGATKAGAGVAAVAASAAPAMAQAAAPEGRERALGGYYADVLLRSPSAAPDTDNGAQRAEVNRILLATLQNGSLAADDRQYLATLVAQRTGLAPADAGRRVDDAYARMKKAATDAANAAKAAADEARKAAAASALWMFIALLIGAFVASLCATFGGRLRDRVTLHPSRV